MNLQNFEKLINNVIVARGNDYYINNCVLSVKEIEKNVYVVVVEGVVLPFVKTRSVRPPKKRHRIKLMAYIIT